MIKQQLITNEEKRGLIPRTTHGKPQYNVVKGDIQRIELHRGCPWAMAVGYDNYRNGLPEPTLAKTKDFISDMEKYTTVHLKTLRDSSPEAT